MMLKNELLMVATAAALSLAATAAAAQSAPQLVEARNAYAAVDYENTRTLAKTALEAGGNDLAASAELYLLWATAAAALDRADEARLAFTFALAANPALKLDRNLSPKIRGPYLEARGAVGGNDGKPPLEVTLEPRRHELALLLRDKLSVASSVELSTRHHEPQPFSRVRLPAAPSQRLPLPDVPELQLYAKVLDVHGNVLFELGTAEEPRRLALVSSTRAEPRPSPSMEGGSAVPYYVTAGSLAALGLAAGGVATAMFLRREDAARDWNSPACEQVGSTRREQCAAIDDRRQSAEYLAIGFAATGGTLLIGSVVTLLLSPTRSSPVALEAGPSNVMLRLRTRL